MKNVHTSLKMAILLVVCLFSGKSHAQMTGYKITFDDPLAYKNLYVNLHILDMELGMPTAWRVGLGAEYTLNRRMYFYTDFTLTPISFFNDEAIKRNQNYFEAGTMFSFSSVVKEGKFKLKFRESGSEYSMKLDVSIHKQRGIRGGIISFVTPKNEGDYIPLSSSQTIFAGIGFMRSKNPLVTVDGHGTYDRQSRGTFYVDAMFAPVVSVTDNTNYDAYAGSASTATADSFPSMKKNRLGCRLGYMKQQNWPIPVKQGFEVGIRPGVGTTFYFLLRVSISLGFKLGK